VPFVNATSPEAEEEGVAGRLAEGGQVSMGETEKERQVIQQPAQLVKQLKHETRQS
jgi:hypothetical protein